MGARPLRTVESRPDSEVVEGLLALVHAQAPIVDMTYGSGVFWQGSMRRVVGCDRQPARAHTVVADFQAPPFRPVPTVVYDPPFHPFVGSAEEAKYSGMGRNEKELRHLFVSGLRACWEITTGHLLVKCQHYVHNHKVLWMPLWAIEELGEPFEWLVNQRETKRVSGRWQRVNSLYRNHADWLVFARRGGTR